MHYTKDTFENFLKNVNLDHYRALYSHIKTVEMDLPKNIQALNTIYDVYWNVDCNVGNTPLSFDSFYDYYYNSCKDNINSFWSKTGFEKDCSCFANGLKARIYRTWTSLITQIHAGYVAEEVFGKDCIEQSTILDHKGIDILAKYKGNEIKIQIKKESKRPEISRMHKAEVNSDGYFYIWYVVPSQQYYDDPYYKIKAKAGLLRECVKPFVKYNPENGTLDRLENGFVIFNRKEFELIKKNFD